jgi:hypothetical protein
MSYVRQVTELAVHVDEQPDPVSRILSTVDNNSNQLLAFCVYRTPHGHRVLLVPSLPQEALALLQAAGFQCDTASVLLVVTEREPTIAARLGAHLAAAGVALRYSYTCWSEDRHTCAVFQTNNQERALRIITQQMPMQVLPAIPDQSGTAAMPSGRKRHSGHETTAVG